MSDQAIWQRQPTTWKIADVYGPDMVEGASASGLDVLVRYQPGAHPTPHGGFEVEVVAFLDGFHVNAYKPSMIGPDCLAVGPNRSGMGVENRFHPVDPEWFEDTFPRLQQAIAWAVDAVRAVREGWTCGHATELQNGSNVLSFTCSRPTGHPAEWGHADSGWRWTDDGEVIR